EFAVPGNSGAVSSSRGQAFAVRAPGQCSDLLLSLKGGPWLVRGDVPQVDHPIVAGRGQGLAVHAPRHAADHPRLPPELGPLPAHSLTAPSEPPEASVWPATLHATERTGPSCPLRMARGFRVATSHSLIVPSSHARASVWPSALHATDQTAWVGPCKLRNLR